MEDQQRRDAEEAEAEQAHLRYMEDQMRDWVPPEDMTVKVLTPGYAYELEAADGQPQIVRFMHKTPVADGTPGMYAVQSGTTNEEVIGMLIDRMNHLQAKMPCPENGAAIKCLVDAYGHLYARTKARAERGVEGQHTP